MNHSEVPQFLIIQVLDREHEVRSIERMDKVGHDPFDLFIHRNVMLQLELEQSG
jgi:hypothetical protein